MPTYNQINTPIIAPIIAPVKLMEEAFGLSVLNVCVSAMFFCCQRQFAPFFLPALCQRN
jgi:hypothetical protein